MYVIKVRSEFVARHNPLTGATLLTKDSESALTFVDWLDAEEVVDGLFEHPTPRFVSIIERPNLS